MEELIIRPSMKFIKIAYAFVILLLIGAIVAQNQIDLPKGLTSWVIPGAFALLLLFPASRHWGQRFTKMTMVGYKLRYETGMLSRATRTIKLSKVQDVTVRQSLGQLLSRIRRLS